MSPNRAVGPVVGLLLCAVVASCGQNGRRGTATTAQGATRLTIGHRATVLAPASARGWEVVGSKTGRGVVDFKVILPKGNFRAFAVRLVPPTALHLSMYGIVACPRRDGGSGGGVVRYSDEAPVTLKLDTAACTHKPPAILLVHVRSERGAKHLVLRVELLRH